ncbi:MAG: hypothetical protein QOG71_2242 [Pyrinomonadaceae bacterium]|nr:hypothetical protein [Pyrinomonadaceae bacterium]
MTAAKQIEALKQSLNLMTRIAANIQTEDYEDLDALNRAIRDMDSELFDLELSLQPEAEELMYA